MNASLVEPQSPAGLHWRARGKPALIHLGCSAAVAALAAALVFTLWYPWPYHIVSGGAQLFLLLVSVDIVLGPLATFAVFDRRKAWPVLRRDLAVIVLLQLAALGYGLHTTFVARPAVLALEGNRFRAVPAVAIIEEELGEAPPELRELSMTGPRILRTLQPTDSSEKYDAIQLGLAGIDLGMRPRYWRPWDEAARREALDNAKPLPPLLARQGERRAAAEAAIARSGRAAEGLVYLPLLGRQTDWVVLVDARSGEVVGFAPLDGFAS